MRESKSFLSDNTAPALEPIIHALSSVNSGDAEPYGLDPQTLALRARCAEFFETPVNVYPVASGTAANSLALSALIPPDGSAICHRNAHIHQSEAGALEMYTGGARTNLIDGPGGKIDPAAFEVELARLRAKADAAPTADVVSITQATELGTSYTEHELRTLSAICEANDHYLHMDGARFFYALAAGGGSAADMTWRVGVDVLSLGMTKCGALLGDVVVLFERRLVRRGVDMASLSQTFLSRRRRGGHALAKMRFVSVQMQAMLTDSLWRDTAALGNQMARELARVLRDAGLQILQPVDTNQVFAAIPEPLAQRVRALGWQFRDWPAAGRDGRRFVTSHATNSAMLNDFRTELAVALRH